MIVKITSNGLRKSQFSSRLRLVSADSLGARIRALRERIDMQSRDLATAIGIDPSAMSNIERGKRGVKTDELTRIAEALGVSPLAILDDSSLLSRLSFAPRAETGAEVARSAFNELTGFAELHQVLTEEGISAEPHLDNVPPIVAEDWKIAAETLADWATRQLAVPKEGDDRFSGLVEAIETRLGVDVVVDELQDDGLIGASITDREFPLIFVNAHQPRPRALFTLAHELGHILVGDGDSLALDFDLVSKNDRERLANAFAAIFLMPESAIEEEMQANGRTALSLARMVDRLGVSFESLVYRLHNLRLIDARGRDNLREHGLSGVLALIEDRDLERHLLGRLETRPERLPPTWLAVRALEGYKRGILSIRPLAGLLNADPDELLELLATPDEGIEAVNETYSPPIPALTDEELFSGDPV